jgi:hypothetical protein
MNRAPRKTLGLAFQDGVIHIAELRAAGTHRHVLRTAAFDIPAAGSLTDPASLGAALGAFLRANLFTARHAVIGLPVQWLMTKPQSVPPAEGAALASLLRIQAERAFSYEGKDLAIDYLPQEAEGGPRSVLLFAALKRRVDQVKAAAEAAGLTVRHITASAATLALAGAAGPNGAPDMVVELLPQSVQLVIRRNASVRSIRHLSVGGAAPAAKGETEPAAWAEALTSELRRVIATDETGSLNGGRLVIWDGIGLPQEAIERMGERLSLAVHAHRTLAPLAHVNGEPAGEPGAGRYAAATALARSSVDQDLVAVDFLNSRLAPPRRQWIGRRMRLAVLAAAALAIALAALLYSWYAAAAAVSELDRQLKEQEPTVEAAEAFNDKVSAADGWFRRRPPYLDCLLHLSRAFPENGTLWATLLSLPDDMRGILSGKATDDRAVLEVMQRLQESPNFSDVKLHGGIRYPQGSDRSQDLSFSISFRFRE